jgi:hypothetical protein
MNRRARAGQPLPISGQWLRAAATIAAQTPAAGLTIPATGIHLPEHGAAMLLPAGNVCAFRIGNIQPQCLFPTSRDCIAPRAAGIGPAGRARGERKNLWSSSLEHTCRQRPGH